MRPVSNLKFYIYTKTLYKILMKTILFKTYYKRKNNYRIFVFSKNDLGFTLSTDRQIDR